MAWRNLTVPDGSAISVNTALITHIVPSGTGSILFFSVVSEAHPVRVQVQQPPATVLSADNPT